VEKVKKTAPSQPEILKRSTFQVRVGVEYANQATIKEGHETGEIERKGLPESLKKLSRSHYLNLKRNEHVLAVAPVANAHSPKKVEWIMDGKPVEFEIVEPYLYAQRSSDSMPNWFTLDYSCIESLSGVC
jgi:hypothetical protein